MRIATSIAAAALATSLWSLGAAQPATAQDAPQDATETELPTAPADGNPDATSEAAPAAAATPSKKGKECQPGFGCVTNLPLPRFVSLKGDEGNARRGPGLTHRIDWVFTRPGMPLRITAEFDNWRRVEDQDGAGGWVHYALLSGTRSVTITLDMAELRDSPNPNAHVVAQAELGVIGRILQCQPEWCRIQSSGERGWIQKSALWGVSPDEIIE
ncbi:SH3 domain-containing protein [Xinfangfangia sp. CPCC 101601]|uniref:SH3 domain-containing protein n=1 Tax=Pseudogemmobacter lacusdianii TaxID=3069608 RepID=A0ABU0VWM6_9RHOB|nr:SH3 domain-containing protein [Xinfangfangia sp. CPCC 101601]MDQ2066108.1 SH3 domain-containing protein [Xinfangfangia sp. CPCC 101601]